MKSSISKNTVLNAALKLIRKSIDSDKITPYDILYGYSRLITLDEDVLHEMFSEPEYKELIGVRRFLSENKLDMNLLRKGIPYLIPYLEDRIIQDEDDSGEEVLSSYDILCELIDLDDSVISTFRFGNSMEDVFSLQEQMQEEKDKKRSEQKRTGTGAENSPAGAQEPSVETQEPAEAPEPPAEAQEPSAEDEDSGSKSGPGSPASEEGVSRLKAGEKERTLEPAGKSAAAEKTESSDGKKNKKKNKKTGKERFQSFSKDYHSLRQMLLEKVKGQRGPIAEFLQGVYQGEILSSGEKRNNPKSVFLFVGPPGVGKTLLAQTAAELLGYPSKSFNMSEYTSMQSHEGLIGVSPIYGTAQEGRLVSFVRENPCSILIFDEIEKAHRNTIQIFLEILDQGTADNVFRKEKTDFSETIIIFTSNACRSIYEGGYDNLSSTPKSVILDALRNEKDSLTGEKVFPAAICSRIAAGNVIMFNYLHSRDMMRMVEENFEKTAQQIQTDFGYNVDIDPRLSALFMFHHGGMMDARIASRQSDNFIKNELYELTRQLVSHPDLLDGIRMLKFELGLDVGNTPKEVKSLFTSDLKLEIAVLCREEDKRMFDLPEDFKIYFADSEEDMKKLMDQDLALILIDLKAGIVEDLARGVSLDDYDSVGIRTFEMLRGEEISTPIYIFTSGDPLPETDVNTFLRRGADGFITVSDSGNESESLQRQLMQIAEESFMDQQGREFARQGKVIRYNTAQIIDGSTLVIRFHDLKKVQALDAESSTSLLADADRPDVRFDDVIGAENAKEELKYFIRYLSNPRKFVKEGGKPAKGLLLYGPPGTGKTMLARAMAGETNFAFIQTSATEFLNKWFGQSEQNVRDLFKRARKFAPAIIFIDEIDAIGKERTGEERHTESVLNALLTEMDGFRTDAKRPVFVIAATNYKVEGEGRMSLDPALVRRFDNRIYVDLPNEKERIEYLTRAIKKKGLSGISEEAIKNIASRTTGVSIAVLQNVLDLAFRSARKKEKLPESADLLSALEEYNFGEKKDWGEGYYRSVSIHEAGHAYVAWLSGEKPSYITIESRGNFGGYMQHENAEDKPNFTKEELIWKIRCALGGRAAEEVFFGKKASLNTGASSDLRSATTYASSMLCDYAMMESQYVSIPFEKILTTHLAGPYLEQVNALLGIEMKNTIELIEKGRDKVQKLADALLSENNLTGEKILEILEK